MVQKIHCSGISFAAVRFFSIFTEGYRMARESLVRNKLRSVLSVLGITIGIYCIVVVYAMVHSLEKNLNDSFSSMGKDVLFVQKWPWEDFGNGYPWWKYLSRPQTLPEEAVFLEDNLPPGYASGVAYSFGDQAVVSHNTVSLSGTQIMAISYGYNQVQKMDISQGRYFTTEENSGGRSVAIIGSKVAEDLFGTSDPVGKSIRIRNISCTVIGVCAKEGQSLINVSSDEVVYIPVRLAMAMTNYREGEHNCQIQVKAADGIGLDVLGFEVEQLMRRYRRLKPAVVDNFAVNRMSMITSVISDLFGQVKLIGLIIGAFSMLVGCFGVANIMFVSVKERTQEIGIQKALGARRIFILVQFLFEAVLLCMLGGVFGLLLVWLTLQGGNYILTHQMESAMRLYLVRDDIGLGLIVSVVVGIVAGFIPASTGARLNPVDAIRSK